MYVAPDSSINVNPYVKTKSSIAMTIITPQCTALKSAIRRHQRFGVIRTLRFSGPPQTLHFKSSEPPAFLGDKLAQLSEHHLLEVADSNEQPPQSWKLFVDGLSTYRPLSYQHPIALEDVQCSGDAETLHGKIKVINLAYQKDLTARYSFDSWITVSETAAEYIPPRERQQASDGYDRFQFSVELPRSALHGVHYLELCLRYTVNGLEFWDSNCGRNFRITVPEHCSDASSTTVANTLRTREQSTSSLENLITEGPTRPTSFKSQAGGSRRCWGPRPIEQKRKTSQQCVAITILANCGTYLPETSKEFSEDAQAMIEAFAVMSPATTSFARPPVDSDAYAELIRRCCFSTSVPGVVAVN